MNRYKIHEWQAGWIPIAGQVWSCKDHPNMKMKLEALEEVALKDLNETKTMLWRFSGFQSTWNYISDETLRKGWTREQV